MKMFRRRVKPTDTAWEDICLEAMDTKEWKKQAAQCASNWKEI